MSSYKTDRFNQLERLDQWIRHRGTGSLDCMAKRLNLSKRTVSNRLSDLRDLGAKIGYDARRQSYYYVDEFDFKEQWLAQFQH